MGNKTLHRTAASSAYGQEQSQDNSATGALTPAEQIKRIDREYREAQEAYDLALQKTKTDEERRKIPFPWVDPFLRRAVELARSHPNDPAAVDALIWRVNHANLDVGVDECLRLLREKYVESEKLLELFRSYPFMVAESKQVGPLLREALAKNPHRSVRGQACLTLAEFLRDQARYAGKETIKREQMTWRSWWDGGSSWGPIAKAWNVTGWPTLYVLNHKGVIRYRYVDPKTLDEVVDKLVEEIDHQESR